MHGGTTQGMQNLLAPLEGTCCGISSSVYMNFLEPNAGEPLGKQRTKTVCHALEKSLPREGLAAVERVGGMCITFTGRMELALCVCVGAGTTGIPAVPSCFFFFGQGEGTPSGVTCSSRQAWPAGNHPNGA